MLAGIDRREQKKASAAVEAEMMTRLRGAAGIVETSDMRALAKQREDRAAKFEDMRVRQAGGECGGVGGGVGTPGVCAAKQREDSGAKFEGHAGEGGREEEG
jgi:hypothetical protein